MSEKIRYRAGYKYQLYFTYMVQTCIKPAQDIASDFLMLDTKGKLTILKGYAWDGPSGPAIDTKNFMRGSLVHDALYQLMRYGLLSNYWRKDADKELQRICLEDGMCRVRAWWVYKGVRLGSKGSSLPENRRKVFVVP